MLSKTLQWTKSEKSIVKIDSDLNALLEKVDFKFAVQNQSTVKGKMIVSIFFEDKPGKIRAKSFKDQKASNLDEQIGEFLIGKKMKFVTQTYIGSNIYTIVFYEAQRNDDVTPPASNPPTDNTTSTPTDPQ